jgi:prevent-host-death family protein
LASCDYKHYDVVMNVPIRKFKAELSHYIREASAGKDVVVTSRGRAVVRIVPVVEEQQDKPLSREELRAKLKAAIPGIRIGKGKFKLRPPIITIRPGEKTMEEIVREGRR